MHKHYTTHLYVCTIFFTGNRCWPRPDENEKIIPINVCMRYDFICIWENGPLANWINKIQEKETKIERKERERERTRDAEKSIEYGAIHRDVYCAPVFVSSHGVHQNEVFHLNLTKWICSRSVYLYYHFSIRAKKPIRAKFRKIRIILIIFGISI